MNPLWPSLDRRRFSIGAGSLVASAAIPRWASAAGARDPRLIVVILRGGLDGLAAVPPLGDPDYLRLHEDLALRASGPGAALPIDGFFGLHPSMTNFARLYAARQALIVHASATNYRQRSHFDGQDVLESGQLIPGRVESGWLNRAVSALPKGAPVAARRGLAVGAVTPLVIRGPAPVLGWAPSGFKPASDDFSARVMNLYAETDPDLARALQSGLDTGRMAARQGMDGMKPGGDVVADMKNAALGVARLIAADDGPRIGAMASDGWDTHASQGAATGAIAHLLGGLDALFAAFERELGERWKDTIVLAVTEFGRTVRMDGTAGTDHGTASVALLAGGAVAGGRIVADWPGLKDADLLEGRDLRPTTDLRAVVKGVLAEHLGLSDDTLAQAVFPETAEVKPMKGLVGA